jgi:hypothetical protein
MPSGDTCKLQWGPKPSDEESDEDPYVNERDLYLDVEGTDDASIERQLSNLGYVDGSLDERIAAFRAEYDGEAADVQQKGLASKEKSGSSEATA